MQKHTIPVHLETQDKLVFGLTTKQVMVLALGMTLSYSVWSSLPTHSLLGLAVSLPLAATPGLFALLVAFLRPSGQGLDDWCMIWLFYITAPKTYLWEPLAINDEELKQETVEEGKQLEEEDD